MEAEFGDLFGGEMGDGEHLGDPEAGFEFVGLFDRAIEDEFEEEG